MTQFHRQSLVAYGQPLCETVADRPTPRGSEVLVRIECCGAVSYTHLDVYKRQAVNTAPANCLLRAIPGNYSRFSAQADWLSLIHI